MKFLKIILLIMFIQSTSFGQSLTTSTYATYDSINRFYTYSTKLHISNFIGRNTTYFNFASTTTYIQDFTTVIEGIKHYKFDQFHNGIPVENGSIYLRTKDDSILNATGLININIPSASSIISSSSAVSGLLNQLNVYKYKWHDTIWEQSIKEDKNDSNATYYPNPQLTIKKTNPNIFNSSDNYFYCYPIKVSAMFNSNDSIYTDSVYIVDAIDGNILKRYSPLLPCYKNDNHADNNFSSCSQSCMSTTIPLHFYTNQTIKTDKYLNGINCTHRLKDNCTGTNLYVKKYAYLGDVDFKSNDNTWTGGGNPSDKVGATVLWCLEQTHDFFRLVLNRNSYDNAYSQIKIFVGSASNIKTGWNIIDDNMDVGRFNLTSSYECGLDIIGHEVSHGVGDKVCFLTQDASIGPNDEEGSLAEGYCDIFGQAVEHFANLNYSPGGATDDFFQGGTLPTIANKQRNLANPKNTGNPDTYLGTNWVTTSGSGISFAHRNSTVLSHWYFLLCNGGAGSNDISNQFCVEGIGQIKAAKIAYTSLFYLGSTAKQYIHSRNATIQAATQLFGTNSNEVAQVTAAWYAVGVGANYSGQIDIKNITVNAPTANYAYNSKVMLQNTTVGTSGVLNVSSNTEINVTSSFASSIGSATHLYIAAACNGGARPNNENTESIVLENEISYFGVDRGNKLDANRKANFSITPNPTNGLFVINLDNSKEYPKQIVVRDMLGRMVKSIDNPSSYNQEFSISDENNGVYTITVYYNDKILNERLIKN